MTFDSADLETGQAVWEELDENDRAGIRFGMLNVTTVAALKDKGVTENHSLLMFEIARRNGQDLVV